MQTSNSFSRSSKLLFKNSNRKLVFNQIKCNLELLNSHIQKHCTQAGVTISYIKHLETEANIILNNVIESINKDLCQNENKLASTFFENRYGFSQKDLKDSSEFTGGHYERNSFPKLNSLNGNILTNKLNNNQSTYQQIRGFKTKRRATSENKDMNFAEMLKNRLDNNPYSKLFNQSSKQNLGSIFTGTGTQNATNKVPALDDKVKTAFAEGILYSETRNKKTSTFRVFLSLILFTVFMISVYQLMSSMGKDNGKGGNGGGISGIRSLTSSPNYEVSPDNVTTKFDDVKGLPEAKQELLDIVDFLKDPEKYTRLGARLPKGVLLVGPPGCGKTLLAKSVAGEAGVPFFQASGSDFDEMFVGTGSKRVRSLFQAARAKAPCVIFIDEIDSVGSTRTNSAVHPHANQTINQLLAEMDGFQKNEGVIVLGATNRRETLDPALMRPGRFDTEVRIDKPDLKQRIEILKFYLEKVAADNDIDVKYLAKQLNGLGGSSIENVVNQGAVRAVVTGSSTVKMEHLEYALDKTLMGYGKQRLTDELANKNTAYHEAGHVLVAYYTKGAHPLHKVTILPRAKSLGHTAFVPENDVYSRTKSQLLAQMDVAMGGRVAEELIFGKDEITTGASGDFQTATQIASQMVKFYGMNESVGIRFLGNSDNEIHELSPHSQEILDQEIKKYLQDSYNRAKHILNTHSRELELVAVALLDKETLDADQIKKIIEQ